MLILMSKYNWITIVLAVFFVALSWPLTQVYLPLGLVSPVIGAVVVIFRIWKRPQ